MIKKNLVIITLCLLSIIFLAGCSFEGFNRFEGETISIEALNGNKEKISVEVIKNPTRVAVLDMACLDIIDIIGKGETVVGCATTEIDYLNRYLPSNENNILNIGTVKSPDYEKIVESEPQIIFIGGRLASVYDRLEKIAPVVYLSTDSNLGVLESTKNIATQISKIYGNESMVNDLVDEYNTRIEQISMISKDKTALITLVSGTSANILTNAGRCSLIGVECGFQNISDTSSDSTHGDSVSFEYFVKLNPNYIFVLDRNSVTGDSNSASSVIENDIIKQSDAYKNNRIIYLQHSNVWYTAEGGINALGIMISDLEYGLGLI